MTTKKHPGGDSKTSARRQGSETREAKLAAALRANLHKRKAQQRARKDAVGPDTDDS